MRRSEREQPTGDAGLEETAATGPGPDAGLDRQDARRRLERALEALSERERAVFVLREMEGMSTREVSRSLGITAITVRRHLARARTHLQQLLEGKGKKIHDPLNEPGGDRVSS